MIGFEDFQKIDLRIAKVVRAEKIAKSEKLLKLIVDSGGEERQIVAGIGGNYSPEELVGRGIVIAANLEPRKIMNIESQGMLLAAEGENGPVILKPDKEAAPGAKIK